MVLLDLDGLVFSKPGHEQRPSLPRLVLFIDAALNVWEGGNLRFGQGWTYEMVFHVLSTLHVWKMAFHVLSGWEPMAERRGGKEKHKNRSNSIRHHTTTPRQRTNLNRPTLTKWREMLGTQHLWNGSVLLRLRCWWHWHFCLSTFSPPTFFFSCQYVELQHQPTLTPLLNLVGEACSSSGVMKWRAREDVLISF